VYGRNRMGRIEVRILAYLAVTLVVLDFTCRLIVPDRVIDEIKYKRYSGLPYTVLLLVLAGRVLGWW